MVNNAKGTNTHIHTHTEIYKNKVKRKSHTNGCDIKGDLFSLLHYGFGILLV